MNPQRITAKEYRALAAKPKGENKYKARKVTIDGVTHDSQLEAEHYEEFKLLERAGKIKNLTHHPKFPILINGRFFCNVILDASYLDVATGKMVNTDSKGFWNPVSRLKHKALSLMYPEMDVRLLYK